MSKRERKMSNNDRVQLVFWENFMHDNKAKNEKKNIHFGYKFSVFDVKLMWKVDTFSV